MVSLLWGLTVTSLQVVGNFFLIVEFEWKCVFNLFLLSFHGENLVEVLIFNIGSWKIVGPGPKDV